VGNESNVVCKEGVLTKLRSCHSILLERLMTGTEGVGAPGKICTGSLLQKLWTVNVSADLPSSVTLADKYRKQHYVTLLLLAYRMWWVWWCVRTLCGGWLLYLTKWW